MGQQEHPSLLQNVSSFPKRFFFMMMRLLRTYLISIGFFATITPLILVFVLKDAVFDQELSKPAPKLGPTDKVILDIKLDGSMTEQSENSTRKLLNRLFGEKVPLNLMTFTKILRRAAEDARVQGIFVELGNLASNRANITELRKAFQSFKESKKKIHFHVTSPDSHLYYLATVSDSISISPTDQLMLPGPVFHLTYFSNSLKKLGLEFEVIKAGKYKSAMEPLVSNEPSKETLQMYGALGENLSQHAIDYISSGRSRAPGEVRSWFSKSFFSAEEAKETGLVDEVGYLVESRAAFKEMFKESEFIKPIDYLRESEDSDKSLMAEGSDKIGYIEAFGTIQSGQPQNSSDPVITPENMRKQIEYLKKDKDVKVVVMRVVSPGGSATASDEIWHSVKELAKAKPLIVSMGGVAASGGYYISAPAQKILADPTTITGSIGVISGIPKAPNVEEKWGLSFHVISDSARKNIFDISSPLTEEDRSILSKLVDNFYQTFLARVAEGRGKTVEAIDAIAQGRVYTGIEAYSLGLVDQLGGLNDAFRLAKKEAGLDENKLYELASYQPPPKSFLDCLGKDAQEIFECLEGLQSWLPDTHYSHPSFSPIGVDLDKKVGLSSFKEVLPLMLSEQTLAIWPEAFARGIQCYLPH